MWHYANRVEAEERPGPGIAVASLVGSTLEHQYAATEREARKLLQKMQKDEASSSCDRHPLATSLCKVGAAPRCPRV